MGDRLVSFVATTKHLETERGQFFTVSDKFILLNNFLNVEIYQFWYSQTDKTNHFIPCTCVRGNKCLGSYTAASSA